MNRTILYRKDLKRTASEVLLNGYHVNGKKVKPKLPILELQYIESEKPDLQENEYVVPVIEITETKYIVNWRIEQIVEPENIENEKD